MSYPKNFTKKLIIIIVSTKREDKEELRRTIEEWERERKETGEGTERKGMKKTKAYHVQS